MIWLSIGKLESIRELIQRLSEVLENQGSIASISGRPDVMDNILSEEKALLKIIRNAQQIIRQHPEMSPQTLYETYGISKVIQTLTQQPQHMEGGEI